MSPLFLAWTNCWTNSQVTSNLRRIPLMRRQCNDINRSLQIRHNKKIYISYNKPPIYFIFFISRPRLGHHHITSVPYTCSTSVNNMCTGASKINVAYQTFITASILCSESCFSGPRLNIKTVLSTYGDFHVKDKTAVRTSYLYLVRPSFLLRRPPGPVSI